MFRRLGGPHINHHICLKLSMSYIGHKLSLIKTILSALNVEHLPISGLLNFYTKNFLVAMNDLYAGSVIFTGRVIVFTQRY